MEISIRFTAEQHESLLAHLFGGGPGDQDERCAFAYATIEETPASRIVLVRELRLISPAKFVSVDHDGFHLDHDSMVDAVLHARKTGFALIEIHSHPHPLCDRQTTFSRMDHAGQAEFQRYVSWKCKTPWIALVYGRECADAIMWMPGDIRGSAIKSVTVSGRHWNVTSGGSPSVLKADAERYDRQILAYGEDGQCRLGMTRLGIVGCGGLGSMIAMQAALIGFRKFVLVDDDKIGKSNLNRLPHVCACDIGMNKTEALSRYIRLVHPDAEIIEVRQSIRTVESMAAISGCDLGAGAVDNDGARLVLSYLAAAFHLPFVDAASDVAPMRPVVAGGRVHVWRPGENCLSCDGLIDHQEAQVILSTPNEKITRARLGYGGREKLTSPSIAHVNAHVAASAVQELHALVGGHAVVHRLRTHRADRGTETVTSGSSRSDYCPCCHDSLGLGRAADLKRFAI